MKKQTLSMLGTSVAVLLILTACAAPAAQPVEPTEAATEQAAPERVEVILTDFTVESSITEFETGKTYEFVITNQGVIEHELRIIPPADADTEDTHGDGQHAEALLVVEAADLAPGATTTVEYTFDEHDAEGPLEFACHIPGHYEANMRLAIGLD